MLKLWGQRNQLPIMLFMINNNMNDTSNAHIMTEKPLSGFNFNVNPNERETDDDDEYKADSFV